MQLKYGDRVHIIENNHKKPKRYAKVKRESRLKKAIVVLSLSLTLAIMLVYFFGKTHSSADVIAQRKWYYVVVYEQTTVAKAQVSAKELKERGGAGFIINDGVFRIASAVYSSEIDAKNVASRLNASVYSVIAHKIYLPTSLTDEQKKIINQAYSSYSNSYHKMIKAIEEYEQGKSEESKLIYALNNTKSELIREKESVEAILLNNPSPQLDALRDYLETCIESVEIAEQGEDESASSRARLATCKIVYNFCLLTTAFK